MSKFDSVLASSLESLVQSPGVGGHVHFDEPEFLGLVPMDGDLRWIELGRKVAVIAATYPAVFVINIPLVSLSEAPSEFLIEQLEQLEPWEPPGIYVLDDSVSAFGIRGNFWHSDLEQTDQFHSWLGAHRIDGEDRSSWRLSLKYETVPIG